MVAAVGKDVAVFKVGDAVYGQAARSAARDHTPNMHLSKASQTAAKPASVDFVTAAALPLVAVSAYRHSSDHMDLQQGQRILIHGGAGGIGSIAIQLAKHLGAYVATTVGGDETEFVKKLGADEAIDYKAQDFSALLNDYDAVFDTIGGETNRKSYTVLKPGGTFVSMVEQPDEALVAEHRVNYVSQFTRVTTERLDAIAVLVDQGVLNQSSIRFSRWIRHQRLWNIRRRVGLRAKWCSA